MNKDGLIKKHKVKSCFAYHEEKTSDKETVFGWKPLEKSDLKAPFVVSYGSKAKGISKEDVDWSKEAGVNAASLEDYSKYFKSLTGDFPSEFLSKWSGEVDSLEAVRRSANSSYRDGEGKFLISLAGLIENGTKFTQYGRIFKVVGDAT